MQEGPLRHCPQLPLRESPKPKGASTPPAELVTSELPTTQPPIPQCLYPEGVLEVPSNNPSRQKRKGFCGQPVGPFLPLTAFVGLALEAGSQPRGMASPAPPEEPQSSLCPASLCPAMLARLAAHQGGGF